MKDLLKFLTCGSVDDGKSTLIGHMLYDAKLLYTDQKRALEMDSRLKSRNGSLDYSLLLDGLMAEREQGITIDVAYRYFSTDNRSFIVADAPGHEEYTRNMAVGASFADLAVILVDVAKGVQRQTRRHIRICNLMGIRHFVFAVNKMDLVHYDKKYFDEVVLEIEKITAGFQVESACSIPVSATEGDNITDTSLRMGWYEGKPLLAYLEQVDVSSGQKEEAGFVMPVQRVCRPNSEYRGFQGQIESGSISVSSEVTVLPNGEKAKVKSIYRGDALVETAEAGWPVSIAFDREVDVSRGCVLVSGFSGMVSNMISARLLWMDDEPLIPGKNYFVKLGTKTTPGTVMSVKYKIDINDGRHVPADVIYKNEIADCQISLSEKIVMDKFSRCEAMGGFILTDRVTNMTSACGVIKHDLRRSDNLVWQKTDVTRQMRSAQKGQEPLTLWFTGLSGSGKSALANALEKRLLALGRHTMLLDGDNVRMGLCRNLGFTQQDRIENIRRVAEVSKLMNDAGLIVLTAFISPYAQDRENARTIIGDNFVEIYVSTPLEVCEKRDVKGLYAKARKGEIPNFTGISSAYEPPSNPEIQIDTSTCTLEQAVEHIIERLEEIQKQKK